MRHGFADKEKEGASAKIDGEKAFVATPNWVEVAPQFSSGTTGTTPFSTPQQRSTVSTTGCNDGVHGFQGRQPMEMRLPKVKRTYGGILRAMWVTLAVCWVANLREAPEGKVQASFPKAPHHWKGQGKGKGQGWQEQGQGQGWWQEHGEPEPCDATDCQNHGAQFAGFQEANGDGTQDGYGGGQGGQAIFPSEGRREDSDACELWCPSSSFDGALEGCGGWQVECRGGFEDGGKILQRANCSRSPNYGIQGCSQGWETIGQSTSQDQEGLRDSQEDEGGLGHMDRTDPGALQPQGQAVRGSSSCMDFGVAGRNHSREECKSRVASSWQAPQGLQMGRGRVGREGLPGDVRNWHSWWQHGDRADRQGHPGVTRRDTAQDATPPGTSQRNLCAEVGGRGNCSKGEGAAESQKKGERRRQVRAEIQEHFNEEAIKGTTREGEARQTGVHPSTQREFLCSSGGGWSRRLNPAVKIDEYSYTDVFRARVESLRQQRSAQEDFGSDPDEEEEESEEDDDHPGRTPEEQRDLETSAVYFSQGFRVLLLRHRVLMDDSLHHILHIPAQWPASRTVSVIEGLWRDLATKQWLLIYARDPTKDSMVIRPGEVAALVVARDELPPNELPIAQEIDLTAHTSSFRQQEISQEFRAPLNSRGRLLKKSGYYMITVIPHALNAGGTAMSSWMGSLG